MKIQIQWEFDLGLEDHPDYMQFHNDFAAEQGVPLVVDMCEFFDNPESDYEFQTLRLVLFFELRCLHHKGFAEDKDYERLNLILRKMEKKLQEN